MTIPITFGKTLEEHLQFLHARDEGIKFLKEKLPKGNEKLDLWLRVFNYEREVGPESDAVQRVSDYWNGLSPGLQSAMEKKARPWLGYEGDGLRMRLAYFHGRASEEFRDLRVRAEEFFERKLNAKSGAKAGLVAGVGISSYIWARLVYEAAINPQLREGVGKEPILYANAMALTVLTFIVVPTLIGAFVGELNEGYQHTKRYAKVDFIPKC